VQGLCSLDSKTSETFVDGITFTTSTTTISRATTANQMVPEEKGTLKPHCLLGLPSALAVTYASKGCLLTSTSCSLLQSWIDTVPPVDSEESDDKSPKFGFASVTTQNSHGQTIIRRMSTQSVQ
jgi:hypothetical protein